MASSLVPLQPSGGRLAGVSCPEIIIAGGAAKADAADDRRRGRQEQKDHGDAHSEAMRGRGALLFLRILNLAAAQSCQPKARATKRFSPPATCCAKGREGGATRPSRPLLA